MTERLLTAAELGDYLGLTAGTILDRFERGDTVAMAARAGCPLASFWGGRSALTLALREQAAQILPPGTPAIVIPDAGISDAPFTRSETVRLTFQPAPAR